MSKARSYTFSKNPAPSVFETSKTAARTFSVNEFRHPCSSAFICGNLKCAVTLRDLSFQLSAGRENVKPPRPADKARRRSPHDRLKRAHALGIGRFKSDSRSG